MRSNLFLILCCFFSVNFSSWSQEKNIIPLSVGEGQKDIQISYQNAELSTPTVYEYQFTSPSTKVAVYLESQMISLSEISCTIYKYDDINNAEIVYFSESLERTFLLDNLEEGEDYFISFSQQQYFSDAVIKISINDVDNTVAKALDVEYLQVFPDQYSKEELVTDVLINGSCIEISNITHSLHHANTPGLGYFEYNGTGFPFSKGVILSTGNIQNAEGPKANQTSNVDNGGGSDTDISQILAAQGFSNVTKNTAKLEFDFVALTENLSFNFIFASDEYGTYQCNTNFADAFVFLLTDLTTGQSSNLAVIPNTTTPISVYTVKDGANNNFCPSQNENYFSEFYQAGDVNAPINFKGVTVPLTAHSQITPGNNYHIKLAIADNHDTSFDSAVFIEGESFDVGSIDLGEDRTKTSQSGALCGGEEFEMTIDLDPNLWQIQWYKDNVEIPGETGVSYTVTEEGSYKVVANLNNGICSIEDNIEIEMYPIIVDSFSPVETLSICYDDRGHVNLKEHFDKFLGTNDPNDYSFSYFNSLEDAQNNQNPIIDITDYNSDGGLDIFILITNLESSCTEVLNFDIKIKEELKTSKFPDQIICDGYILPELYDYEAYYTESNKGGASYKPGDILSIGNYEIYIYSELDDCIKETSFKVSVLDCHIPKGISPNGDGLNDSLDLTYFVVEKIYIYNRYGKIVYKNEDNYTNQWVGQNMNNEGLPSGTYFYEIYTPVNYFTGWIQLNR